MGNDPATGQSFSYLERLWNAGQQHLVMGRYMAACRELQAAEAMAWRRRDALSLARLWLPLLEARRQVRQNATDGLILIAPPHKGRIAHQVLERFTRAPAGTLLLAGQDAGKIAGSVTYAAYRSGACREALLLLEHGSRLRLCSPADPHLAAGLEVRITRATDDMIDPGVPADVVVPLPPPGAYGPGDPLHAVACESIVVAWEALALKWQARHPAHAAPWEEMAWLRLALRIDPAAEPVAMRLMALADVVARQI